MSEAEQALAPPPKSVPREQVCKASREGDPERTMGASQDVSHQDALSVQFPGMA